MLCENKRSRFAATFDKRKTTFGFNLMMIVNCKLVPLLADEGIESLKIEISIFEMFPIKWFKSNSVFFRIRSILCLLLSDFNKFMHSFSKSLTSLSEKC